jgi:hypothetical protein
MAILTGKYEIPSFPVYSDNMKFLIQFCLHVNVNNRPDIFQLYERVCSLRCVPYDLNAVLII